MMTHISCFNQKSIKVSRSQTLDQIQRQWGGVQGTPQGMGQGK
jgi:hypothetical protein